jgi:hypothetical protein
VPACEPVAKDVPVKLMLSKLSSPGNGRVVDPAAANLSSTTTSWSSTESFKSVRYKRPEGESGTDFKILRGKWCVYL